MYLRRFISSDRTGERLRAWAGMFLCVVALAGCAVVPGQQGKQRGADSESAAMREVPPQAQTMYEQAVAAMASGDSLDAQLRFQEFLLRYPDFPGAHVNLAIIYVNNADEQAAEAAIADALIIDAEHPAALNQLGMLRRRQGNFIEAEAAYLKAVTAHPDYPLAHYNLGVLNELYLQRLDAALQYFGRYQELTGEDKQVARWIVDLERRIDRDQRTAKTEE
jgi:tetratricopeptide (TPR) repeat protein